MVTGVFELPNDLKLDALEASREWFVAGVENWMVYELFRVIAHKPHDATSQRLSPIVLRGHSGSGKSLLTRLLAEIWTQRRLPTQSFSAADWIRSCPRVPARDQERHDHPDIPCVPASGSRFLLDDIQQLVGHESAQHRLVSYLDAISHAGGVAVLTTQTSLSSGRQLIPALSSRLRGGTSIPLSFPDTPSRCVMIQKLARQSGWTLDAEAVAAVDSSLPANPRLLAGRLRQLLPQRPFCGQPQSIHDIKLRLGTDPQPATTSADHVITEVARQLQIPARLLRSQSRRKNVVHGRSIAIYLIRKMTNLPLKTIGASFSNRDHATVLHAIQKVESALPHDLQLTRMISELQVSLQTVSASDVRLS